MIVLPFSRNDVLNNALDRDLKIVVRAIHSSRGPAWQATVTMEGETIQTSAISLDTPGWGGVEGAISIAIKEAFARSFGIWVSRENDYRYSDNIG